MKPIQIRDAVTVVLLCKGRLLMVKRQPYLPSFSGFTAFPGGKVESTDSDLPASALVVDGVPPRLLTGLVREVWEELGIDLSALAEIGQVAGVHSLGCATTPAISEQRFCTHFFRVDLLEEPPLTVEIGELVDACWATPAEWLGQYHQGHLLLAPPTLDTVAALAAEPALTFIPQLDDGEQAVSQRTGDATTLRCIEPLAGLRQIFVRSNTLPPASHTNAFLIGDNYKVLVDPSPANRDELARLVALLDETGVDEVLLTHHHPDHREYANEIASRYDVPLAMSDYTRRRIAAVAPDYMGELLIRIYVEGDVVTRWLGRPVRAICVPGHDEGQLALMPDDRAWFIVGDLIQGIGSVVIHKPEGNMGRYFKTLEKVIALNPAVIIPSHGQALGTTYRLTEVLNHRLAREASVLEHHQAGKSIDEILPMLYTGIDPRLMPLARMNIESHLDKLLEEGRIAA